MKVTLNESASQGPYIVGENGTLYMAWAGTTNTKLNVISSIDGGQTWGNKVTLEETSAACPALVFKDGVLYMAWTGTNGKLNLISSLNNGATWGNKITLPESSPEVNAPWLMVSGDDLLLAWTGTSNAHPLNLASSPDGGKTWINKVTIDRDDLNGGSGPSLVLSGGELIMAFTQEARNDAWDLTLTLLSSADGGATWGTATRLPQTSLHRPFLLLDGGDLVMAWRAFDLKINLMRSTDGGQTWGSPTELHETCTGAPCLAESDGSLLVGWIGTNFGLSLNVETVSVA